MTRRAIRESIFKILFKYEFNDVNEMEEQIIFSLNTLPQISEVEEEYVTTKINDIISKLEEIDNCIKSISEGWSFNRIGKAELAIIRLAIFEMNHDKEVPFKVAINEAVELSKIYCNEEASKFVNALLAKVKEEK